VPHPEESYAKTNGVTRVLLKDQTCIELPFAQFAPIAEALATRANEVYLAFGRFGERQAIPLNAVVSISAWTPEQLREMEADSALYTDHEERPWE
jgi:hypothetical protein